MNTVEADEWYIDYDAMRTPMDKAVERGDLEFVKKNLDTDNNDALYECISQENTQIFEYAYPLFSQEKQIRALSFIADKGRLDYLDFALHYLPQKEILIYKDAIEKDSPHESACRGGHMEMVIRLEALGIQKARLSFTYAFRSNNLALIEYLYRGESISELLTHDSHYIPLNVLQFVMSKESLNHHDREKILYGAAAGGAIDVIEHLLSLPDAQIVEGLLFETVYMGAQLPTMKYLMEKAPILSNIAEWDYKAFIWAYEKGYENFVEYLVREHGIGPDTSPDVEEVMQSDDFALYNKISQRVRQKPSKPK